MSRIETTKLHPVVVTGDGGDAGSASKLHVVLILEPGDDDSTPTPAARQGYCFAQVIRRD